MIFINLFLFFIHPNNPIGYLIRFKQFGFGAVQFFKTKLSNSSVKFLIQNCLVYLTQFNSVFFKTVLMMSSKSRFVLQEHKYLL